MPPFGSDEGWDEVYEWAGRADELNDHPTVRYMIESDDGMDADEFVSDLADTDQPDVDDILIGLGFALLRYTGQIDAEGRVWLEQALDRQINRYGGGGAHNSVLGDLRSFTG